MKPDKGEVLRLEVSTYRGAVSMSMITMACDSNFQVSLAPDHRRERRRGSQGEDSGESTANWESAVNEPIRNKQHQPATE